MTENTWGFDFGEIDELEGGFQNPPVGTYKMEVVELKGPTTNKKGELYIIPICEILEAAEDKWEGRKYSPYMALNSERAGYTKMDLRRMGANDDCLSGDGDPQDLVGLVFTVDLVQNGDYINMRNIESATEEKPKPKRSGGSRR